jgi:hypothetical protein
MSDQNEKLFQETLETLEKLVKENENDGERILELINKLESPIADESLDIFRREFQENIRRRAKT